MEIQEKIRAIEKQRDEIAFISFSNAQACELGWKMYEAARTEGKSIVISITKNRQQIFYAALDGTSKNNDDWIKRKENTAYYFGKSSYEMALYMKLKKDTLWNRYGIEKKDYAQAGGSVPVVMKDAGMIGTVTVSGMTEEEDHEFVIKALKTCKLLIDNEE